MEWDMSGRKTRTHNLVLSRENIEDSIDPKSSVGLTQSGPKSPFQKFRKDLISDNQIANLNEKDLGPKGHIRAWRPLTA